ASSVQDTDNPGYSRDERDLLRLGKKPVLKSIYSKPP
ncbi:hypothetical protein PG991_011711, partial [Apiospora marii]